MDDGQKCQAHWCLQHLHEAQQVLEVHENVVLRDALPEEGVSWNAARESGDEPHPSSMTPDMGNRDGGFRPPLHLRTPKKTDMPRQYRVIDVVPTPPMTESSSVTAHDIEAALNVHAKEGWELLTVLEHFSTTTDPSVGGAMGSTHSGTFRTSVTLIFQRQS
jgi:hypothetical protein